MINWRVRFKNKVWLTAFCAQIVTFVFTILSMFDIYPAIEEATVLKIINAALFVLSSIGVIVDPTTAGIGDSERALEYQEPAVDGDTDMMETQE